MGKKIKHEHHDGQNERMKQIEIPEIEKKDSKLRKLAMQCLEQQAKINSEYAILDKMKENVFEQMKEENREMFKVPHEKVGYFVFQIQSVDEKLKIIKERKVNING